MTKRTNGPILTSTRRDVLRGDYDAPSRQAELDHRRTIKENTKLGLEDFQFLFDHLNQEDLEDVIGGGPDVEGGPVSYDDQHDVWERMGWAQSPEFFSEHVDDDHNPRDPEYNPDANTRFVRFLEKVAASNKATPETQETLIDCVAFLCRAAEAGELDVQELIERGVERYYRDHPTKKRRMVNLRSWTEESKGGRIKADYEGPASFEIPSMGKARDRYLSREGYKE